MSKPYRWLGDPHERQHVFLGDDEVGEPLCHSVRRTSQYGRHPDQLRCFYCKNRLRSLKELHKVDLQEIL